MRKFNFKIVASIVFFTAGILFFSLGVQKYRIITSSRASLSLPQCEIPDGESMPTNLPCSSCNIYDGSIDDNGNATIDFSCQIQCNSNEDPQDTTDCPANALPYNIEETSWYWCRTAGDQPCTNELTDDLLSKVEATGFTEGGPWILSEQGDTPLSANFSVAGFQNCGRVQVDIITNQPYSYIIDTGTDCDSTLTSRDVSLGGPPTPTYGFGYISQTPSNTPVVPQPTIPPSKTPTPSLTSTPAVTNTPIPTVTTSITGTITPTTSTTPAVTGTISPSVTLSPSPSPTLTSTPTATFTPTATLTATHIPTATYIPTPISNISVDGQSPGGGSWLLMLVPAGLVVLGLLL